MNSGNINKFFSRRRFLAAAIASPFLRNIVPALSKAEEAFADTLSTTSKWTPEKRKKEFIRVRNLGIKKDFRSASKIRTNSDLKKYDRLASFSKGLDKDDFGLASETDFKALTKAIETGTFEAFEDLKLGGPKKLKNPAGAYVFDLIGADPSSLFLKTPPSIKSSETAAEMIELYWIALCRDVEFRNFPTNDLISSAASELSILSDFNGPSLSQNDNNHSIFRTTIQGVNYGPYLSQFLYQDIPYGANLISPKIAPLIAGNDYMTTWQLYNFVQKGFLPGTFDTSATRRYMVTPRDLARWDHDDKLSQGFIMAALYLLDSIKAPLSNGHPYFGSATQDGFTSFGYPHLLNLLGEVASIALQTAWYYKWVVHRRLRPEELGGRVHIKITQNMDLPINDVLLNSKALSSANSFFGSYLLPQAYPEGAPGHPAYPSGHAVVAGACATILKAWFNNDTPWQNPVQPSIGGASVEAYTDSDASSMTVGSEINKLAWNVGFGRCLAGVHFRSDITEGLKLGEKVAVNFLQTLALTHTEPFDFRFKGFQGNSIRVRG